MSYSTYILTRLNSACKKACNETDEIKRNTFIFLQMQQMQIKMEQKYAVISLRRVILGCEGKNKPNPTPAYTRRPPALLRSSGYTRAVYHGHPCVFVYH